MDLRSQIAGRCYGTGGRQTLEGRWAIKKPNFEEGGREKINTTSKIVGKRAVLDGSGAGGQGQFGRRTLVLGGLSTQVGCESGGRRLDYSLSKQKKL